MRTMSRVKSVAHLNIQTTDKERTRDFYEKVFDAVAVDQGQLQVKMGDVEIHFCQTSDAVQVPLVHFAMEVDDWDGMMATLAELGVEHGKTLGLGRAGTHREQRGGDDPSQGRREHTGAHYTYIHDPDRNVIELIHYPVS
jgi:catechol 2,3-dioxygenase-like lactoylglutathione lyase family enzyme